MSYVLPTILDLMEYANDVLAQAAFVTNGAYGNTGGAITTDGLYKVHTFLIGDTLTNFNAMKSGAIEVLVVAGGGGGGGHNSGGGGGAGGLLYNAAFTVPAGNTLVTVGGHGNGGAVNTDGVNGGNSVFSTLTSIGGGGGGGGLGGYGNDGGSGGGNGGDPGLTPTGQGTDGQGYDGGPGTDSAGVTTGGGGGGGAAEAGGTNNPRAGGDGVEKSISGAPITYAAGGGGGNYVQGGGGGAAATLFGSGGGGGNNSSPGGNGFPGIVIIRCLTSSFTGLTVASEATIKQEGSYSLKGIAAITASLNKTLTRTVSPTINLTDKTIIKFDIRASRTGSNIKIGIHDSGGTTTEITPVIAAADTWQTVVWDISAVANANKDVIDSIVVTIVNADAENTFYIDNMFADTINNYLIHRGRDRFRSAGISLGN